MKNIYFIISFSFALTFSAKAADLLSQRQKDILTETLTGPHWRSDNPVSVFSINQKNNNLEIIFTPAATTTLISAEKLKEMSDSVKMWTSAANNVVFKTSKGQNLRTYLPQHQTFTRQKGQPLLSQSESKNGNLYGRNIALWGSHGYYYERTLDRWEWQRARLFGTVEDLYSSSFAIEFLLPMLENAGANVFLPRECDMQTHLYVADNSDTTSFFATQKPFAKAKGYAHQTTIVGNENPFLLGTAETFDMSENDSIVFYFNNIEKGNYYVYICYEQNASNSDNVSIDVQHHFGTAQYAVNQQRGGGMWVCLGQHTFDKAAKIILKGKGRISADAVRLGGGMGMVARGEATSQKPRYVEAARYYLQTDGFDAAVYSPATNPSDYTDDLHSHGEWVNALKKSKNIDVDLAVALHTDAFQAGGDTTIGTLAIVKYEGTFSNGEPRRASRDVAYLIESQIASDLRKTWNSSWTTRGIWHKNYSESLRPDCPSLIVEMLSHQNFNDVRYGQHPQFRFDMCRAIYKGIVRFLEGENATIQPLPVSGLGLERIAPDSLRLTWQKSYDQLEPSAVAERYLVFANGNHILTTSDTSICLRQMPNGTVTEYTVRAQNAGGLSFKSKGVCAALLPQGETELVVDGQDRVSAPAIVRTPEYAGIAEVEDLGTAWHDELHRTGAQYDYDPQSPWLDDDCPGWGASHADEEGKIVRGARASLADTIQQLANKGVSIITQSKIYFEQNTDTAQYAQYHILLGQQRTTWYGQMPARHAIYTPAFVSRLTDICASGKKINIGGCYVGTELNTCELAAWAAQHLGFKHRTNHASKTREVVGQGKHIVLPQGKSYGEPDAIEPASPKARTIMRYADTNMSAAVEFGNIKVFGF